MSIGYHGDDGHLFMGQGQGTPFGLRFTQGDIVGCGVDWWQGRVFFCLNGSFIGECSATFLGTQAIYPIVGMRTHGEKVRVNFGQTPFAYDMVSHVRRLKLAWRQNLTSSASKNEEAIQLIVAYLIDQGYSETVESLTRDKHVQLERAKQRRLIKESLLRGDIATVLASDYDLGDLTRELLSQQLVEAIRRSEPVERILEIATRLSDAGGGEAMGLLAYPDPLESPLLHLFYPNRLFELAEQVHRLMMAEDGRPDQGAIAACLTQLYACLTELQSIGSVEAALAL